MPLHAVQCGAAVLRSVSCGAVRYGAVLQCKAVRCGAGQGGVAQCAVLCCPGCGAVRRGAIVPDRAAPRRDMPCACPRSNMGQMHALTSQDDGSALRHELAVELQGTLHMSTI